jgi:hypothetical protein
MTIMETLNRIDTIKPNGYSQSEKIKWLSVLDGIVKSTIIDTHEGGENVEFDGYTEETNPTTELLVPFPSDDIYIRYLEMQIDYANGEYNKYENSQTMYNATYSAFARAYNRTHMPKGTKFKFFGIPKTPEYEAANAVAKVSIEED